MRSLRDIAIGAAAGTLVAIGGATKDAPYEGFKWKTFLRSPIIGAIAAPLIAAYNPSLTAPILGMVTIAAERATVETYKVLRQRAGDYVPAKFKVGEWGRPLKNNNRIF